MILQEPRYLAFAGLFVLVSGTYLLLLRGIFHQQQAGLLKRDDAVTGRQYALYTPSFLLLVAFMLLGIRGRTEKKSPIIIGTAFFSDNAFINQVGLNPVFTFMRSWIDSKSPDNQCLHWISDVEAVHTTAQLLHSNPSGALSPVARQQTGSALFKGRNVVLVMMESMSAAKMGRYGCADQLTPYLDSLAGQCWSFDSVFSAGIHTYNGIYSTLFAHPALMKRHTMEQPTVPAMAGLPNTLAQHGYQTVFFTTHDEQFDNMSGFLYGNGMQQVIGEKDYPGAEVKSTLGVPDEYMFRYAVPRLTDMAAKNKPFLAAFMTASDHNPRVIPTDHGFVPRSKDVERQAVEYADWSIRQLMQYASQQSWYNNTMFVFVADHGAYWGGNAYDIVFSYHHIPLMIYAPGGTESKTFKQLALQTDVFPTVTSLLLDQYINNTLGIDLLSEHHPYLVFSADDKLACMNDSLLYVHRENGQPSLYKYRHNDIHDYIHEIAGLPGTMQQVAFSWLQTSQWMLQQQKTGLAPAAGSLSARHTNP
jgi:arylsulfatase A-like enzyme